MDIRTALSISSEIAPQVEKMTDALIDALLQVRFVISCQWKSEKHFVNTSQLWNNKP